MITISYSSQFIEPSLPLGSVHTMLEEFENAALLIRLRLSSTLIRQEQGAFREHYLI